MNFNNTYHKLITILALFIATNCTSQKTIYTDVLVVGGGASGTTAGIQAARMGVKTIIVEPTTWLGGMITSAGVSAFDGNHNMPSGIWAEFREQLYKVYGGANKVATGWVSNTLFEPHVGDSIFKSMVSKTKNLNVLYNHQFTKTIVKGKTIKGAIFFNEKSKSTITILAKQTIDATELGDVMANAKIGYDIGLEASSITGENVKVTESLPLIQDLTYVAILKDFGKEDKSIAKPENYDPMEFDGCCNEYCSKPEKLTSNVTAKKMLDYGKLPNGKYMINWPGKGNDIYLNIIELSSNQRDEELKKGKAKTIRFLYFLQNQFGFKNLGLATDEYPTKDKLPFIPYHRESRRLQGVVRFKVQDIGNPFNQPHALYRTGIAVGDYPIDHHHRENELVPKDLGFYPVPSYNLPIGVMIPKTHEGIIVAEKSISVSNIVNGTTRLQPVVVLIGQAAGTLAAMSVQQKKQAINLDIRTLQEKLLEAKVYIMPYYDIKPNNPFWEAIQKIGATGILKGRGEPNAWANRTWFDADSTVKKESFLTGITPFLNEKITETLNNELTIADAELLINKMVIEDNNLAFIIHSKFWEQIGLKNYDENRKITRGEMAVLLNKTINPFTKKVDYNGNFK